MLSHTVDQIQDRLVTRRFGLQPAPGRRRHDCAAIMIVPPICLPGRPCCTIVQSSDSAQRVHMQRVGLQCSPIQSAVPPPSKGLAEQRFPRYRGCAAPAIFAPVSLSSQDSNGLQQLRGFDNTKGARKYSWHNTVTTACIGSLNICTLLCKRLFEFKRVRQNDWGDNKGFFACRLCRFRHLMLSEATRRLDARSGHHQGNACGRIPNQMLTSSTRNSNVIFR